MINRLVKGKGSGSKRSLFNMGALLIAEKLFKIGVLVTVTRLLLPAEVGTFAAYMVVVYTAEMITNLCISSYLVQRKTIDDGVISTAFTINTLLFSTTGLLILLFSVPIGSMLNVDLSADSWLLMIILIIKGLATVPLGLLLREHRGTYVTFSYLTGYVLGTCLITIPLILSGYSYLALIYGVLFEACIVLVALYAAAPHSLIPRVSAQYAKEVAHAAYGLMGIRIGNYLRENIGTVLVARYLGLDALGLFNRGYKSYQIPMQTMQVLLQRHFFPKTSRLQDDPVTLTLTISKIMATGCFIALITEVSVSFNAGLLVELVFGDKWLTLTPVLTALIWIMGPNVISATVLLHLRSVAAYAPANTITYTSLLLLAVSLGLGLFYEQSLNAVTLAFYIGALLGTLHALSVYRKFVGRISNLMKGVISSYFVVSIPLSLLAIFGYQDQATSSTTALVVAVTLILVSFLLTQRVTALAPWRLK